MTADLFIDSVIPGVRTLGPGMRIGVWVQGCTLACPGCIAPNLFIKKPDSRVDGGTILDILLALSEVHDGLTIAGGEPFQQAAALASVLAEFRERTPLNILIYSGYTMAEIRRRGKAALRLLECADALIDGRYRAAEPPTQPWAGSGNQRLQVLTSRFPLRGALEWQAGIQTKLGAGGRLRLIGIPQPDHRRMLRAAIGGRLILEKEGTIKCRG